MAKLIFIFCFLLLFSIIIGTFSLYYYESVTGFHEFIQGEKNKLWSYHESERYQKALINDEKNMKYSTILGKIFLSSVLIFFFSLFSIYVLRKDMPIVRQEVQDYKARIKARFLPQQNLNSQNPPLENDK